MSAGRSTASGTKSMIDDLGPGSGYRDAGLGPRGMWWVAWRLSRTPTLVMLALIAVLVAAEVFFRIGLRGIYSNAGLMWDACGTWSFSAGTLGSGCGTDQGTIDAYRNLWLSLRYILFPVPFLLGIASGLMVLPRRSVGTFVRSQSVTLRRWHWTSTATALVPVAGMLVILGFVTEWASNVIGTDAWNLLQAPQFQEFGVLPAAIYLACAGLTIAVSSVIRPRVYATLAAVVMAGLVGWFSVSVYPHLVTPTRVAHSIAQSDLERELTFEPESTSQLVLRNGVLDRQGNELTAWQRCHWWSDEQGLLPVAHTSLIPHAFTESTTLGQCARSIGAVAYFEDRLTSADRFDLVIRTAGLLVLIGAAGIAGGAAVSCRRKPAGRRWNSADDFRRRHPQPER